MMASMQHSNSNSNCKPHPNHYHHNDHLIDCVIGNNNMGVGFFENQEFSNAFKCFREALHQLKARISIASASSRSAATSSSCSNTTMASIHRSIVPRSPSSLMMGPGGASSLLWSIPKSETTFVIHSHTFHLGAGVQFSTDAVEEDKILSAILIFNSALVFHFEGLKTSSLAHLSKALMLYRQAYALLHDYVQLATATGNALLDLLCMATLNNLGLLHRDLQQPFEARESFAVLIQYVHTIRTTGATTTITTTSSTLSSEEDKSSSSSSTTVLFLDEHIEVFLLNAALLGCSSPMTAPAA